MRVAVVFFCLFVGLSVGADEVTDAVEQALDFYDDGKSQQAITQLEFAAQLIRQQRGSGLAAFFPAPLDGWEAGDATSQSAAAAMFGGGTSAEREYTDNGASVTIRIITDSPLMTAMMMMFANPMIAASQGGTLQSVGGQQALVKPDEVTIVVNNTYLIMVEGDDAAQADLLDYAGNIDFQGLAAFN